jgi:nucleotide-binding universal stress UspA family protein
MYKTVLLAYDGSLEGALALREGALLARRCGAKIVLLSVVPNTGGIQLAEGVAGGVVAHQHDSYKALLKRAVEWLRERGFEASAKIVVGEPAPTIGKVANEVEADLVVVGHQRRSALARWWSGSTNAYLSDNIGCSLLMACKPISDEAFDEEVRKITAG